MIKYKVVLNFWLIVISKARRCKKFFRSKIKRYRNYNRGNRDCYCCNTSNKDRYLGITKLIDLLTKWAHLQIPSQSLIILLTNNLIPFLNNLMLSINEQKIFAIVTVNFILIYRRWKTKPIKSAVIQSIRSVPPQTSKKGDLLIYLLFLTVFKNADMSKWRKIIVY